jgi:hypothetical protein
VNAHSGGSLITLTGRMPESLLSISLPADAVSQKCVSVLSTPR